RARICAGPNSNTNHRAHSPAAAPNTERKVCRVPSEDFRAFTPVARLKPSVTRTRNTPIGRSGPTNVLAGSRPRTISSHFHRLNFAICIADVLRSYSNGLPLQLLC